MRPQEIDDMLTFKVQKSVPEILTAVDRKVTALTAKITERQGRIAKLREEYEIDDAALVQLFQAARRQSQAMRFSYSTSNKALPNSGAMEEREIGAGVVNNLLTESDNVEADKASLAQLQLIQRNLRPVERMTDGGVAWKQAMFDLTYDELRYLGF